ncbi:MAG: hypothetical protein WD489_04985, partial [Rhodovibrionaceae bacterium]
EMLQRTMKMFSPFPGAEGEGQDRPDGGGASGPGSNPGTTPGTSPGTNPGAAPGADQLDTLKQQVDQLQKQLEAISKARK